MTTTTIKGEQSQAVPIARIPTAPPQYDASAFNQIIDITGQNFDSLAGPNAQEESETLVELQTSSFTVGPSSGLNLIDTTGGAITVTLQPAASYIGRLIIFKRITAGANNITIQCSGAEKIDGAATITMPTQWQARGLKSTSNATGTGSAWVVVWSYL